MKETKQQKVSGKTKKMKETKQQKVSGKTKKMKETEQQKVSTKSKKIIKPKIKDYKQFQLTRTSKITTLEKTLKQKIIPQKQQIEKAIKALLKLNDKSRPTNDLLTANDQFIYLEIITNKVPSNYSIRPTQIPLPHQIYSDEYGSKFAIICKDPQRELKDKLENLNVPCIAKAIGYGNLQKKYPTYLEKRKLCTSFDYFFCDYRLYSILKKPMGKIFYERKKFPFPIQLDGVPDFMKEKFNDNYESYLNDLNNYTYFIQGNGPVYTVKVARTNMNEKQIIDNVIAGIYNTLPILMISGLELKNFEQFAIKTFNSISLPIYNQLTKKNVDIYLKSK